MLCDHVPRDSVGTAWQYCLPEDQLKMCKKNQYMVKMNNTKGSYCIYHLLLLFATVFALMCIEDVNSIDFLSIQYINQIEY